MLCCLEARRGALQHRGAGGKRGSCTAGLQGALEILLWFWDFAGVVAPTGFGGRSYSGVRDQGMLVPEGL